MTRRPRKEPKGWGSERERPLETKRGIVIYKRGRGDWIVNFPDDYGEHYGRTSTAELLSLFAWLAQGKSLKEARRKIGWER